jgi:maleate cis-trans isomerase
MSNADIIAYLRTIGVEVVHDVALGLQADEFANVTPQRWFELAKENDRVSLYWRKQIVKPCVTKKPMTCAGFLRTPHDHRFF